MRVRDIVVRDPDGTVVASAPKAEIHVSGLSLLSGHMRAESLNLVGATMSVRIEPDGNVTVFAADADKRPIATANVPAGGRRARRGKAGKIGSEHGARRRRRIWRCRGRRPTASPPYCHGSTASASPGSTATICANSDLKDGTLTVDDERTGKRWTFEDISLSLQRPRGGGMVVTVGSANAEHPWGLTASIKPTEDGSHSIALEARQVSANDLLLASRFGDGSLQFDMPLSASLRGVIGAERRAAIA